MKDEKLENYKESLKRVENLIKVSERKLNQAGYDTSSEFPELENNEKILFPSGIIRPVFSFRGSYRFNSYLSDKILIKNLCYALQGIDVFSFFLNRYFINLSAGAVFKKMAIVNVFSIIEGILFGMVDELHSFCENEYSVCKKNEKCPYYMKGSGKYSYATLIDKFEQEGLLNLTLEGKLKLETFKSIRDNIHIHLVKESELDSNFYTITTYNNLVRFLHYLRDNFAKNVIFFKLRRKKGCIKVEKIVSK